MKLDYFLSGKMGLVVVTLKGELDDQAGPVLKKCLEDLDANVPTGVVAHLAEATMPEGGFREFSLFLRGLKAKYKEVKISSLNIETKAALQKAGLLSTGETRETLVEAIKDVAAKITAQNE